MRIDQLLVQRGLASTRSQAQRLIADGVEWESGGQWRRVQKNGDDVAVAAPLRLLNDAEARYVSRGGLKLEAAIRHVGIDVHGLACMDVGQSTGGFTDCLLQHGAHSVVGIDVGSAQLHPSLRSDPRVLCVEGINARSLSVQHILDAYENSMGEDGPFEAEAEDDDAAVYDAHGEESDEAHAAADAIDAETASLQQHEFAPSFDLIVGDLSFISQTLVLPAIVPMLKSGGVLLMLVKPQFELQPGQVGKGGIVRDASLYAVVEARLRQACADLSLDVTHWFDSPIAGGDGNREFFMCSGKRQSVQE